MSTVTSLVLKVAFSPASPNIRYIIFGHDLLEHLELLGGIEGDEVHAPVPAKVTAVEPVPVLELMPGFTPGQKIVVVPNFHMRFSFHALFQNGPI